MATWNRAQSLGVSEPTLNAASVAPHQLKNDTVPIMTWWLLCMSFSVDISLSAQHHLACNKTNIKLSPLGSVSSKLSCDYIFARTKRQPCVWVPQIPKPNQWESAKIPFMQTLLTQCSCAHRGPDPNVIVKVYIVTVYIHNGTRVKEMVVISTTCSHLV